MAVSLPKEKDGILDRRKQGVVVNSFLFVLGTNGRMQPVVMAPKNLRRKQGVTSIYIGY